MTDTPSKEWIERANEIIDEAPRDGWRDYLGTLLARELQSSFNQGVARERERCAPLFEIALTYVKRAAATNPTETWRKRRQQQAYRDAQLIEEAAIQTERAKGNPSNAIVERFARALDPSLWAKIDENISDDDWNGGAALNARDTSLTRVREAMVAAGLTPQPTEGERGA